MKKNKFMRVAAVLLILCLATTCAISSTFAKYTTSDSATDSARVAKWGVTVTATGDFFAETYASETTGYTANTVVSSATGTNVVAPGTTGTLANVTLAGSPEVAVRISYDATLTLSNWSVNDAVYCPLVITVNNVEYKIDTTNTDTAKLAAAVETAIEKVTADYAANTDLSGVTQPLTVTWAWAYEGGNDASDTALGNLVTDASADNDPSITLAITTTITQLN